MKNRICYDIDSKQYTQASVDAAGKGDSASCEKVVNEATTKLAKDGKKGYKYEKSEKSFQLKKEHKVKGMFFVNGIQHINVEIRKFEKKIGKGEKKDNKWKNTTGNFECGTFFLIVFNISWFVYKPA